MFIFGNELLFSRTLYNSVFIRGSFTLWFLAQHFSKCSKISLPFICSSFAISFLCFFSSPFVGRKHVARNVFFFIFIITEEVGKKHQKIRQKLYRKGRETFADFRFALYLRWRFNNMDHFTVSQWNKWNEWGRLFGFKCILQLFPEMPDNFF